MGTPKPDDRIDLNLDFDQPMMIDTSAMPWDASPAAGVERRRLERACRESGHATSIVRYAPGSRFSAHTHTGGEEFLVLDGVFSDEKGDYPTGTYVRNPPGSSHAPSSRDGCIIFVKLCQMQAAEVEHTVIRPDALAWQTSSAAGIDIKPLFDDAAESVFLQRVPAMPFVWQPAGGHLEVLLLSGRLRIGDALFGPQAWLRWPAGSAVSAVALEPCVFWCKQHRPSREAH